MRQGLTRATADYRRLRMRRKRIRRSGPAESSRSPFTGFEAARSDATEPLGRVSCLARPCALRPAPRDRRSAEVPSPHQDTRGHPASRREMRAQRWPVVCRGRSARSSHAVLPPHAAGRVSPAHRRGTSAALTPDDHVTLIVATKRNGQLDGATRPAASRRDDGDPFGIAGPADGKPRRRPRRTMAGPGARGSCTRRRATAAAGRSRARSRRSPQTSTTRSGCPPPRDAEPHREPGCPLSSRR